jgi:ABC-2 type transport system ATP-binding protein
MLALELAHVSKRYGRRPALNAVDLSLTPGETLGLLGPNGSGKTSVLRLLLGHIQPSDGTVRLRGLQPSDPESRVGVAYLPERLLLPSRTSIRSFLNHHAILAGLEGAERARDVDAVLEQTGLSDRGGEQIGTLSKGLTQRVGFAQAFLASPELLLLDEPTSGLDPIGIRDARDWVVQARARGCSVLVSSHLLSEVEQTCDRIAIINEGQVVANGRLEEILHAGETLEDAFVRVVRA